MKRRALGLAWMATAVVVMGLAAGTLPSSAGDGAAQLAPRYRQWLEDVALIITARERKTFLALAKDYQRDGFIQRFWEARNPYPGTVHNSFKEQWEARLERARESYGNIIEDRARMLLLHGPAQSVFKTDCMLALWPLEIWHYDIGERIPKDLYLTFSQPFASGPYRLWRPQDGYFQLVRAGGSNSNKVTDDYFAFIRFLRDNCQPDMPTIMRGVFSGQQAEDLHLFNWLDMPPPPRDPEWLQTFGSLSTDLAAGARELAARVEIEFPDKLSGRTVVEGSVLVSAAAATATQLGDHRSYNFLLHGEVLRDAALLESFRYRFEVPVASVAGETIPLTFERSLWPGEYVLILRLEDLASHAGFRDERPLTVPRLETARAAPGGDPRLAGKERQAAAGSGQPGPPAGSVGSPAAVGAAAAATVKLVPPEGNLVSGAVRIDAEVGGEAISKVAFFLDGKEMLSKTRAPFSVELNLGELPRAREVRAIGYDAAGNEVASDTLRLNAPRQGFAVHLVEPRPGARASGRIGARAEVNVPDGATLERVELYLGEDRVATLYQPPYAQSIPLPRGAGSGFVRAVAYLADGSSCEDLVLFNTRDFAAKVEVRLVELYATVIDGAGRPVVGLTQGDFKVYEDGVEQPIQRFAQVKDLPINVVLLVDTSASMARSLGQVQKAALSFLERTLTPKDKAALISFNDAPLLRAPFTNDLPTLAGALAGLNAERGTALFDSLVYALSYMKGAHGQEALLLFTDGDDRLSRLSFEKTREFARRSGIAIYTIGAQIPRLDVQDRSRLGKLAEDTGGRAYFIDSAAQLGGAYQAIEEELRARYLLVYQAPAEAGGAAFRAIEVRAGAGREVKTLRGYYP
jgi:Ca-activated chloride channel homolog